MEYGHGARRRRKWEDRAEIVLILLLMEYGHGGNTRSFIEGKLCARLNPSFNGIWSWRPQEVAFEWSSEQVLILLLMEYGHGATHPAVGVISFIVLILLLMEYGHGGTQHKPGLETKKCLNPSFNGIWSWRKIKLFRRDIFQHCLNPSFNGIWSWRKNARN